MSLVDPPPLTPEEQQLTLEISSKLKEKDIKGAEEKIAVLIEITKNSILKNQYSELLKKLKKIKKSTSKAEKEEDKFRVKVEKSKIRFTDVKGMGQLKKSLKRELVLMIKSRDDFIRHKLKPSGILLYGPPGVGKTFFLEALAGEFDMSVIKVDLASLFSQWVGETEKNIKRLIEEAKNNQPCLIILDETDAKIRNRENIEARGESVVNLNATTQFLETMQEVHNENLKILFTGATNRVWDVDPAAKRPGRLGNLIYVPSPSLKDRFMLFRHYLKTVENLRISAFGYLLLALATAGYSPTDVEEICIQAKKEMLYKNINLKEEALYTREEYLKAKAEGKLPKKPKETLATRDVLWTIKKNFKSSSLDIWYVEAYKSMVGWDEIQKRTVKGKILSKTVKEKVRHEGKITKDERKLYKDMLKDVKRSKRTYLYTLLLRKFTRWVMF